MMLPSTDAAITNGRLMTRSRSRSRSIALAQAVENTTPTRTTNQPGSTLEISSAQVQRLWHFANSFLARHLLKVFCSLLIFLLFISPSLLTKGRRGNILTDSFRRYTATFENRAKDNGTDSTSLALTHYADAHRGVEALQNMSLTLLEWSTLFRSASANLIDISQDTGLGRHDGAEAMSVAVAEYAHQVDETARHVHEFHLHIWRVGQSMSINLLVLARKLERHWETNPFWRAFDTTGFQELLEGDLERSLSELTSLGQNATTFSKETQGMALSWRKIHILRGRSLHVLQEELKNAWMLLWWRSDWCRERLEAINALRSIEPVHIGGMEPGLQKILDHINIVSQRLQLVRASLLNDPMIPRRFVATKAQIETLFDLAARLERELAALDDPRDQR